jgi:hypothetical protein
MVRPLGSNIMTPEEDKSTVSWRTRERIVRGAIGAALLVFLAVAILVIRRLR